MAEVLETVQIVNKTGLPNELSSYETIERTDSNRLYGYDEAGKRHPINHVAELVMRLTVETGLAEEVVDPADQIPSELREAVEAIVSAKTADLTSRLEAVESENSRLHKQVSRLEADKKRMTDKIADLEEKKVNPPKQIVRSSDSAVKQRWHRATGRLGDFITGRQTTQENDVYQYRSRAGRTVITEEEVIDGYSESSHQAGVMALGGVAVTAVAGGVAGYLLGRHTGHTPKVNFSSLNQHINNVDTDLTAKINQVNNHVGQMEHKMTLQHAHSHRHDLQAMQGLRNEIARDHRQEMTALGRLRDQAHGSGLYWGFRYPWDWAVNKVGSVQAEAWLHRLAAKAAAHHHKVQWIKQGYLPNGAPKEILQIDGTTDTTKVISVLNQFS